MRLKSRAPIDTGRLLGKTIVGGNGTYDPENNRDDVVLALSDGSELTIHNASLELKEPTHCPTCGKEL